MSKQDRQGVRTPAQLERKYNFGGMSEGAKTSYAVLAKKIDQMSTTLAQFMGATNAALTTLSDDVKTLSDKVDKLTNPITTYTITNNLTNCTNEDISETIAAGMDYVGSIICDTGYYLSSVQVTMGGVDITEDCCIFSNDETFEMEIEAVSGDIVITAVAE
jgi:hypothetical protein